MADIQLPPEVDWEHWVNRYDRMQERYLVRREERFEVTVRMIRATQKDARRVLDLGCGTGTLTAVILEAFPHCQVIGVDIDSAMLALAGRRLERFGRRAELLHEDLRCKSWLDRAGGGFDAVVSSTALHWLSAGQLTALYSQLAGLLRAGGIFVNADHVGSESQAVQTAWEQHREKMRRQEQHGDSDTWDEFFAAYAAALGVDPRRMGSKALDPWEGIEEGLPLWWHCGHLQECGFAFVECFWRCDCDAVYGAIRRT